MVQKKKKKGIYHFKEEIYIYPFKLTWLGDSTTWRKVSPCLTFCLEKVEKGNEGQSRNVPGSPVAFVSCFHHGTPGPYPPSQNQVQFLSAGKPSYAAHWFPRASRVKYHKLSGLNKSEKFAFSQTWGLEV